MIRSVILIILISIGIAQCVPLKNKVSPLKLNKFIKSISVNGKFFGSGKNFTRPFGHFKSSIEEVNSHYAIASETFGQRVEGKYQI